MRTRFIGIRYANKIYQNRIKKNIRLHEKKTIHLLWKKNDWSKRVSISAFLGSKLHRFCESTSPDLLNNLSEGTEEAEKQKSFLAMLDKIGNWFECDFQNSKGFEFSVTFTIMFE